MAMVVHGPSSSEKLHQRFQWGPGRPVLKAQVKLDPKTGKNLVFLRDILPPKHQGSVYLKYGDDELVQFLTDENEEHLEPLRFEYLPHMVLQIFDPINGRSATENYASDITALTVSSPNQTALGPEMDSANQSMQVSVNERTLASITQAIGAVLEKQDKVLDKQDKVLDNQHKSLHNENTIMVTQNRNHAELVDLTKATLNWLATIHEKATSIFRLTYELHEFPIPRLFVILPGRSSFKDKFNPLVDRYRLYFLCECDQSPTTEGDARAHIHFAKHNGYDLERPTEFCRKYGPYILAMFRLLSVAMFAGSFAVPAIAGIGEGLQKGVEELEDMAREQLMDKMNETIDYLKRLPNSEQVNTGNDVDAQNYDINRISPLQGADLRHLASFLKDGDKSQVLANLYRLARPDGTIKWVCLDHYGGGYNEVDQKHFQDFVDLNDGTYYPNEGKVEIRLRSKQMANQFYPQLDRAPFVHELIVTLDWNATLDDLKEFRRTIKSLPTIRHLSVDCCNAQPRIRDFSVIRGSPSTVLNEIMGGPGLQSFSIKNCDEFLIQVEKLKHKNELRKINLGAGIEGRTQLNLLSSLVKKSPQLQHLTVQVPDFPSALLLFTKPDKYMFKAGSILEAQVETGESLTAKIHGNILADQSLLAMDCTKDLSAFIFVSKLTTAIKAPSDVNHLGVFLAKANCLKEIVIEVEASRFFDIRQLILQKANAVRSVYFHDKSRENSLKMTNIQNLATAEVDLLDDSADFERLLTHFGAAPRLCGKHVTLTNEIFAKLEANTRKLSRISFIEVDISILDDKGVENAISVIQRSALAELSICASAPNKAPSMETSLLWNLIKEVVPCLKETILRVQCPEGQICQYYKFIRSLVSADMNGSLELRDGSSTISLDDIQDVKSATVLMNSDNLGMPLEDFYEMFGCLPSVLGVDTPISESVIHFLEKTIQPEDKTLKRLTFDPRVLSHGVRDLALDLIRRCSLDSLDVHYHEDAMDLIIQMVHILGDVELTVHCKSELIPEILGHLRRILPSGGTERRLRLTDDSSTIIFDNFSLTQFRLISKGNTTGSQELFDMDDILSATQGSPTEIIPAAAAKMEQWTRSFPSPYTKIWVDTSKLDASGIQDMAQVISRSKLSFLKILCSKGEEAEKDKRKQLMSKVLPCLDNSDLHVQCPVKEFAEIWQLLKVHESPDQLGWRRHLLDGERRLDILPNADPKLVIQGARATHDMNDSFNMNDELGNTMRELGPYVEHLDMETVIFSDKDADQWLQSISGGPRLSLRLNILRLSTAFLTHEGLDHMNNILEVRSHSLKYFAFICDCNQSLSTAAIDMLRHYGAEIRELVLRGSKTQQWIQALSAFIPDRESLPLMTSLKIISNGETLDDDSCSWISSMTQAGKSLPGLKKIHLGDVKLSSKAWTSFFQLLDKASLEELDLSGSNVSEIDICAAGYNLDAPLKLLNLQRTKIPPSSIFVLRSLTDGRPLEILLDGAEQNAFTKLLEFSSSS